jgi:hypothetical protein
MESDAPLTPDMLAESLPPDAVNIIIVEGLGSGYFQGQTYPPGTTLLTSSAGRDNRNKYQLNESYSSSLFGYLDLPLTVRVSHYAAANTFLLPGLFMTYTQNPGMTAGKAADWELNRRFVPTGLSDFIPPRILEVPASLTGELAGPFTYRVRAVDNRDNEEDIHVTAEVYSMGGCLLSSASLVWSSTEEAFVGTVEAGIPHGFFLRIAAADRAGNRGEAITLWYSSETGESQFDLNGDGSLSYHDLFQWAASPCLHYPLWWGDFMRYWGMRRTPATQPDGR